MTSRIYVSDNLSIFVSDEGWLQIQGAGHGRGLIGIDAAELPALLRELNAAAEAMGVTTEQGELVKFAEAFKAFTARDDYAFMEGCEFTRHMNELAEQADKALAIAKAEQ